MPFVESGYDSLLEADYFGIKKHQFLVLICNDVLFSDWEIESHDAEAIVVVSHLEDLATRH